MEQIKAKAMDFGSGQGANHSHGSTMAKICNAAMAQKTRFYVPDSVQHHTSHAGRRKPVAAMRWRRLNTSNTRQK
ncbi:MAG: hypothetical protein ACREXV_06510 [Polaromonas sp.]